MHNRFSTPGWAKGKGLRWFQIQMPVRCQVKKLRSGPGGNVTNTPVGWWQWRPPTPQSHIFCFCLFVLPRFFRHTFFEIYLPSFPQKFHQRCLRGCQFSFIHSFIRFQLKTQLHHASTPKKHKLGNEHWIDDGNHCCDDDQVLPRVFGLQAGHGVVEIDEGPRAFSGRR